MAQGALVIGWGSVIPGREQKSLQVFSEAMQYYGRLQQQGTIESFEPVALDYHGGDLQGFIIVKGEREKLNALRTSEEFLSFNNRAAMVINNLGVINAFIGEELQRLFADFGKQANELT